MRAVGSRADQYQKELDLVNRIDPQTRQISSYIAAVIPEEDEALRMLRLLTEHGVNLNFKDQMKQTILFYVSRDGKHRVLQYLHDQGLDINDSDLYGQTPLFYAARENRLEYVRRLIELGCNVNHVDSLSSQTALFYSAREGHTDMCRLLMDVREHERYYLSTAANRRTRTARARPRSSTPRRAARRTSSS